MFKYVGDSPRVFPTIGLIVEPGDVVDVCPDPVFFVPVEPGADPVPAEDVAPATEGA